MARCLATDQNLNSMCLISHENQTEATLNKNVSKASGGETLNITEKPDTEKSCERATLHSQVHSYRPVLFFSSLIQKHETRHDLTLSHLEFMQSWFLRLKIC